MVEDIEPGIWGPAAASVTVRSLPSHAGRLPRWQRLVFAVVFALMAGFVVLVTVSAARSGAYPGAQPAIPATGHLQVVMPVGGVVSRPAP